MESVHVSTFLIIFLFELQDNKPWTLHDTDNDAALQMLNVGKFPIIVRFIRNGTVDLFLVSLQTELELSQLITANKTQKQQQPSKLLEFFFSTCISLVL